jgi:NitT/TauT family transport system permease protein
MAHSRALERAIYPLAILVKVTPVVAVAPLLIIWFGFGPTPKVLVAALITFFPMLVNAVTGLRSIDESAHDFLRSLDASRWQVFRKLVVPSTLPWIISSLRVNIGLAMAGAIVGEFISSQHGLGRVIMYAGQTFDVALIWVGTIILSVVAVAIYALVGVIESRLLQGVLSR